jgi:hypothetical protein
MRRRVTVETRGVSVVERHSDSGGAWSQIPAPSSGQGGSETGGVSDPANGPRVRHAANGRGSRPISDSPTVIDWQWTGGTKRRPMVATPTAKVARASELRRGDRADRGA